MLGAAYGIRGGTDPSARCVWADVGIGPYGMTEKTQGLFLLYVILSVGRPAANLK